VLTRLRKKLLLHSRLYLVLDKDTCHQGNIIDTFRQLGKGAIDLVQLRANTTCDRDLMRDAKVIKQLANQRGIVFIVNNRLDIAQLVGADGLHLGQSDLPLESARRTLGKDKIIGISCHNLSQALNAQSQGADYISIGPLFCTKTKPGLKPINPKLIKVINQRIRIPYFAIGGLGYSNINKAASYGVKRIALCRAICRARNITKASINLRKQINKKIVNN